MNFSSTNAAQIAELKERAAAEYSSDEIDNFITMGKQLAGKTVLEMLKRVVCEGPTLGLSTEECERISKKIDLRIPFNYCGFVQCEFKEISHRLNISLSIVDRDYKSCIDIPHESYARDLYQKYEVLRRVAIAYWRQFAEENEELFKRICDYRKDIDFSQLRVNEANPSVMYFDSSQKNYIGIFPYYVDSRGNPFYKKK